MLVGDIEPDAAFALVEKYIGVIPPQEPPAALRTVEPEQKGERRIALTLPAQTPLMQMAWHVGSATDESLPALKLLTSILTNGDSSRLHRLLVEQEQAAIGVGAYVEEGFDPGLAWVVATLPQGGDLSRVEALIDAALADVIENGVTDAEVRKAKNLWTARFWRTIATINGKAEALGEYEVFHGDYRKLFEAPDRFGAVTAGDIQARGCGVEKNQSHDRHGNSGAGRGGHRMRAWIVLIAVMALSALCFDYVRQ